MGISIGGGSSKSSSSTNQTQTTTAINPDFVNKGLAGLGQTLTNLNGIDPTSLVAGPNQYLTGAATAAQGLGQNQGAYDTANNVLTGMTTAGPNSQDNVATVHGNTLLSRLQDYMSPYTNDVVDTTLANYDRTAGSNRAQQLLSIGGMDDTFGGSGAMSYLGNYDASNQLNRAQTEAGLRDTAFNTGANLSNLDADRRQQAQLANQAAYNSMYQFNAGQADTGMTRQMQAAGALPAIDQARNADARANIDSLGGIGGTLQGIDQARAAAPVTLASTLADLWGSNGFGLLHGETSNLSGTTKGKNSSFGWSANNSA